MAIGPVCLRLALVGVTVTLALACSGDDGDDGDGTARSTTTAGPAVTEGTDATGSSWTATATVAEVPVYAARDSAEPTTDLANPTESGAPLVFLVDGEPAAGDRLRVHLPLRPNGRRGWVQAGDVALARNDFRIAVDLTDHELTVSRGASPVLVAPIGVGTADTPTPGGVYYIKELIRPPDPTGPYGPYAYGLSGFSNNPDLADFAGGTGVIGIHGTDEPGALGTDVSHGCIRVHNDVITEMATFLPLGTPVQITE